MTDYEYLKRMRYNWEKDERKLKVWNDDNQLMEIPDGRCFCCGRLFENHIGEYVKKDAKMIETTFYVKFAYCNQCEEAMSLGRWNSYTGQFEHNPKRDYEYFHNVKDKLEIRARRVPIDFDTEDFEKELEANMNKPKPIYNDNFKLANGVGLEEQ